MKTIITFFSTVAGKRSLNQLFVSCVLLCSIHAQAQQVYELTSPDGKLKATVNVSDKITYTSK